MPADRVSADIVDGSSGAVKRHKQEQGQNSNPRTEQEQQRSTNPVARKTAVYLDDATEARIEFAQNHMGYPSNLSEIIRVLFTDTVPMDTVIYNSGDICRHFLFTGYRCKSCGWEYKND